MLKLSNYGGTRTSSGRSRKIVPATTLRTSLISRTQSARSPRAGLSFGSATLSWYCSQYHLAVSYPKYNALMGRTVYGRRKHFNSFGVDQHLLRRKNQGRRSGKGGTAPTRHPQKENRPWAQTQGRFQMQDCLSRFTRQQLPLPVQLLQQEQLLQQQPARQP